MLVLAHRGLHQDAPENTMAAFEAAVAAGVDGIETDVRLTADGIPVLFHDMKCRRRNVAGMTRMELSRAVGHHVPSLAEAVDRFDVLWDVEIKAAEATDSSIDVLRRFSGTRRFFVTSFRRDVLARVASSGIGAFGLIVERAPLGLRASPGTIAVWRHPLATARRVRANVARGRRVFAYGARTARDHDRLVRLGVTGVITDRPDLLRRG
jgi:glycerophosphoryl diester phosphodiesterase